MDRIRPRTLVTVALLGTLALASNPQPTTAVASPCRSGPAAGVWELPHGNQDGYVDGVLSLGVTGMVAYYFQGTLVDVPSPCLSCVEGNITGVLDDGVGVGPDYEVRGTYFGSWFGGTGQYSARIYKPIGPAIVLVGKMKGTFDDPLGSTVPGSFQGQWRICD